MTRAVLPRLRLAALLLLALHAPAYAQRAISFAPASLPASGTVVVPVREGLPREGVFDRLDAQSGGALRRAATASGFKGAAGRQLDLPGIGGFDRILLVGLGAAPDANALEQFGAAAGRLAASSTSPRIDVLADATAAEDAARIAFGAQLGGYRFERYRSRAADAPAAGEGELVVHSAASEPAAALHRTQWAPVARGVAFARDLGNEPANAIYPETFVERTREAFAGLPNVRIEVLDVAAMRRLGMGAMLAVGEGSARPPRMLLVRYDGAGAQQAPLAFVGKGITFDSGGISLKDNDGMASMKYDMAGAAAVTGAVLALAARRAPVNAVAVAALAENMPSATAARPGDVVRTMSGKTFEVMSTDAEGRMVLSDAVWYVQQQHRPKLVIDLATLTGSVVTALGDEYAGLFSRDDALATQLLASAERAGEPLWRLPLHASYAKDLESPVADLRNGGARGAGAGLGAHFIGEFVQPGMPWAHVDIAGTAWRTDNDDLTDPRGATAWGVRMLDRFVRDHHEGAR